LHLNATSKKKKGAGRGNRVVREAGRAERKESKLTKKLRRYGAKRRESSPRGLGRCLGKAVR
jgi:hypothetical protein